MTPATLLQPFLLEQDGVVTTEQARTVGVTPRQLRTLTAHGWSQPTRGVYIAPDPIDAFRAGLRAELLHCPEAIGCGRSAARVHKLSGLPIWTAAEVPELLLPATKLRAQRPRVRVRFGPGDGVERDGFVIGSIGQTISQLCYDLTLDDMVCLLDSALRLGWEPADYPLSRARLAHLSSALALSDGRSESALETLLRLLLVRAGLAPEELQWKLFNSRGILWARLDIAWPSCRLVVEADGREYHDQPEALYKDRGRQNDVGGKIGWTVLRYTWWDVKHRPRWIVAQVRATLARLSRLIP
jgi:very-short-patch-repair endonuclease